MFGLWAGARPLVSGAVGSALPGVPATVEDHFRISDVPETFAAGARHTCAVTDADAVKCWGDNGSGQLGDGTNTTRTTPVDVNGLGRVKAIAAGADHTCAVTDGGAVKCWGANSQGQLGDGTRTTSSTPVDVKGLGGVKAIAAGELHTCAVTDAGAVKCWGDNGSGQLGDGTYKTSVTPVDVSGLGGGVKAIAAGADHSCALTDGGAVKCWGYNAYGQLGDGRGAGSNTPVDVSGLGGGVKAIAAGAAHTCAVTEGGTAKCWGNNEGGQLGDGTRTDSTTPVDVSGL